ncbi:Eco57I restriction-modification methylase domain-containing protein, partial [Roseiflexus castenholzii]|uniref:Eco57I restriction-modification methylase domain-containing protein n=1 Tax=Roseiflexus castenholzii TaxID=120962 RepID=UPI003C79DD4B
MRAIRRTIEGHLTGGDFAQSLPALFCQTLHWGAPRGLTPRTLHVGAPVNAPVTIHPVAHLAGLPVFRMDWDEDRLPSVAARRAVQKALKPLHAEHLLCSVTRNGRRLALTWARPRPDGATEGRTLSYEVGSPARTTIERLAELAFSLDELAAGDPPITAVTDKLNRAFDVEAVTKRFYQELANWFFWARDQVDFPMPATEKNREAAISQRLIRLITRLIFCWFMKEMGLIPRELFDRRTLSTLLKDGANLPISEKPTFYKAILHNLFFATLNQEIDKRQFRPRPQDSRGRDPHWENANRYRFEDAFTNPDEFLRLVKTIPFLNGGLFEIDGASDRPNPPFSVPDYLFFGEERRVDLSHAYGESRYETVCGLIHIFTRYNFTVTESTPLDQEVALDPELAGKVFENLLAAYNPETATTARKATGSYYTPRPIVDFMVDESLMASLKTQLETAHPDAPTVEARLRRLLAYHDELPQFSPEEVETLITAIDKLKALDPACGSGAFPMGLLHKLVFILGKLDPRNERWKERQIAKAGEIPDATIREKVIADIEQAFAAGELDYGRKLYLIENCIYGVDIQPIAVQIAKMRFFISLTVDQKIDPSAPNRGIRPLPNLETKFVAANTLIGIERPAQLAFRNPKIDDLEQELKRVREQHFTARTQPTKQRCRERDAQLRAQIAELLKNDGWGGATAEHLAAWDPYDQNASADFFDPEWMFGIRDGFDMVIGNPPYIQLQSEGGKLATLYQTQNYHTFDRRGDIYALFYERGMELLKDHGFLCYITSNKWMRAGYGEKLRRAFTRYNPLQLIDLGPGVFENATVDTNILLIQKAPNQNQLKALTLQREDREALSQALQDKGVPLTNLTQDAWFIGSDAEQRLKEKIERLGKPLKEWDVKIYYGIKTGFNEAFIITTEKRNEIVANCQTQEERARTEALIKPILRGRDIKRYYYEWAGLWVIVIPAGWTNKSKGNENAQSFIEKTFPALMQHLKPFEEKAKKRDDQGDYWWELRHCAYYPEFEKEK